MKHKGILLDLDNTVYGYQYANEVALDAAFSKIEKLTGNARAEIETAFALSKEMHYRTLPLMAASHSRVLQFQGLFERLGKFRFQFVYEIESLYWETFYRAMRLEPGVLHFLKTSELPICIVTDFTSHVQYEKLMHLKLDGCIDAIVTSEEAGVEKPHAFIFMLAAKKLGLTPASCVMIGDHLKKDVVGALAAGCDAVYYADGTPEALARAQRETLGQAGALLVSKNYAEIAQWI